MKKLMPDRAWGWSSMHTDVTQPCPGQHRQQYIAASHSQPMQAHKTALPFTLDHNRGYHAPLQQNVFIAYACLVAHLDPMPIPYKPGEDLSERGRSRERLRTCPPQHSRHCCRPAVLHHVAAALSAADSTCTRLTSVADSGIGSLPGSPNAMRLRSPMLRCRAYACARGGSRRLWCVTYCMIRTPWNCGRCRL